MSTYPELSALPAKAADWIDAHGWTQGVEQNNAGAVCLTGALRFCDPKPGDWLIVRAVMRHREHAEGWNDARGRTEAEVTEYLRSATISDADLDDTFGPQWGAVVGLVRAAADLTAEQCVRLDAAWAAALDAAWAAARAAALDAARAAARAAALDAAWAAARAAASYAAWAAARALVVRDLIGHHGFTQAHYDTLIAPWVAVMGAVHPDDAQVTA